MPPDSIAEETEDTAGHMELQEDVVENEDDDVAGHNLPDQVIPDSVIENAVYQQEV